MQRLRFLNPVMDSEVKKALEVLALSHDTQKKAVSLHFAGEGKRNLLADAARGTGDHGDLVHKQTLAGTARGPAAA